MKKSTNKKLTLNKQKISELSQGNMKRLKGGFTYGVCTTLTRLGKCKDKKSEYKCPPPILSGDCRSVFVRCVEV